MKKSKLAKHLQIFSAVEAFERKVVRPAKGLTLIVGSKIAPTREDRRARYAHAIGLDMQAGEGVDIVHDLEEPLAAGPFWHVECVSVLEHCRRPWLVASNIEDAMHVGATIFLSVPFVWRFHAYPDDYWRFTASGVKELFPRIAWQKMMYGHHHLTELGKLPNIKIDGCTMFPRTEVYGFGRRV